MIVERSQRGFRASVPCKVNLFLEVLGKREDGYHSLETVMMACSLTDDLEITHRDDSKLVLEIRFPDGHCTPLDEDDPAWRIPADQTNLILRTLDRLRLGLGLPKSGAHVILTKRIPALAGLGGGSADAAAAIVLGMMLWQRDFNFEFACATASVMGSDVNFFLEAQPDARNRVWTALCSSRGESILPVPCSKILHLVIVHPPRGCGTREVFQKLDLRSIGEPKRDAVELLNGLRDGDVGKIAREVTNRLEGAASQTTDWVERSRKRLDRYDHHGQALTGSGSARFCLCETAIQAETIARELRLQNEVRAYSVESWQSPSIAEQVKRIHNAH